MTSTSGWTETPDKTSGRPYYWNRTTNDTAWIKPDELLTPAQLATGWTQTSADNGRIYWFNKSDKNQTSWDAPPGWTTGLAPPVEPPQFVSSSLTTYNPRDSRDFGRQDDREYRPRQYDSGGYRGPVAKETTGYENASDSEKAAAFTKLLKKVGVQSDWTWTQAVEAAVQDPAYRAVAEPIDRAQLFDQYQGDLKRQEAEREQERVTRFKQDFRAMLQRHDEVKRYSRWDKVKPALEHEAIFRSAKGEEERKKIFDEYVAELALQYMEKRFNDHERAMGELRGLLEEVKVTPETRWAEAQVLLQDNETFQQERFTCLTRSEVLNTFIKHVRDLWDKLNTVKQSSKSNQSNTAREARDDFWKLLLELRDSNDLHADSTWKSLYAPLSSDPRYATLLDNVRTGDPREDGSTPQDMFFYQLERIQRDMEYDETRAKRALKGQRVRLEPDLPLSEFIDAVQFDKKLVDRGTKVLEQIHRRLIASVTPSAEDAAAAEESKEKRRLIEALRNRIQKLEPAVGPSDKWELVRPRIERLEEYAAIADEDDRRAAFEKAVSRAGRDRDRGDKSRRNGDRDRDRGDRDRSRTRRRSNVRGDRASSRPSTATSERERDPDHYAIDRRRQAEQRERRSRGDWAGSNGGLSPPPKERGGRYIDGDQPARRRSSIDDSYRPLARNGAGADRRGDRRLDERHAGGSDVPRGADRAAFGVVSRADTYSSRGGELDYGDDGGAGAGGGSGSGSDARMAKRGAGDEGGRRGGAKRSRIERNGSGGGGRDAARGAKVDAMDVDRKEEVALQSGSEEGEIEEVEA